MVVKKLENPIYYRRNRQALPGKGVEISGRNHEKTFDQYLLEAFDGEVVQNGGRFSKNISPMAKDNLIRLSQA